MAVAIRTTDFPEGVGTNLYDGVQNEMDVKNNPPEGLVFHMAGEVDGTWTSKLGDGPLIRHLRASSVAGPSSGHPIAVYSRSM